MTTIVFLHAHPDDEATQTSGSMARATGQGDRVVVVYATNGDLGDVPDDLRAGETLVDRRHTEAEASARATGTQRVEWLGYVDSGMLGWQQNTAAGSLHIADLDEAAKRLVAILDDEDADVLVGYDWHGNYGHPDHVRVHEIARRARELAARRPRLLESTMNRDVLREWAKAAAARGEEMDIDADELMLDGNPIGTPATEITWQVDVSGVVDQRRASVRSHLSQNDIAWARDVPDEVFVQIFASEWYIEPDLDQPLQPGWPFVPDTP